ncbi:hypothetical protein HK102_008410 [Quaeritorhiza haematococci]|nr:hypothetical protein HK102_008410 [Quaeritorhiza haematococci]
MEKFVSKLDKWIDDDELSWFHDRFDRMKILLLSRLKSKQIDESKWTAFEKELDAGIKRCKDESDTKEKCRYPVLKAIMDDAEDLFGSWDYKYLFLSEIWNKLGIPKREWTKLTQARNDRKRTDATAMDTLVALQYWRDKDIEKDIEKGDLKVTISQNNVVQASQLNTDLERHFKDYFKKAQWDSFAKWDKIKPYDFAKKIDKD